MKKSCPASQGYLTFRGETTCLARVVSPPPPRRQFGVIHINGCWNSTTTQGKVNSPRVTQREGCLGYPRQYKWGPSLRATGAHYRYISRSGLERTGLVKRGLVKRGLVKRGLWVCAVRWVCFCVSDLKVTVDLQRPNFANFFFCAPDIAKASI